jgi:hypothetical protein
MRSLLLIVCVMIVSCGQDQNIRISDLDFGNYEEPWIALNSIDSTVILSNHEYLKSRIQILSGLFVIMNKVK